MFEQLGVLAAGIFSGVGKDGEVGRVEVAAGQVPLVVGCLGQPLHEPVIPAEPGGVDTRRAEGQRAEDVAK